jgi:hypothetical protein
MKSMNINNKGWLTHYLCLIDDIYPLFMENEKDILILPCSHSRSYGPRYIRSGRWSEEPWRKRR